MNSNYFYIVSTINNIKKTRMVVNNYDDVLELEFSENKILLCKNQYLVSSAFFSKFQAVVSKEFFKENFEIIGRAELEVILNNGKRKKSIIGVLCKLI